ncbi:hypothetical protein FKM82_007884 [Ascaphus truei]
MTGKVVTAGRGRLGRIPGLLVECRAQAALYGKCVSAASAGNQELRRGTCAKEFEALKHCFTQAAKRNLK